MLKKLCLILVFCLPLSFAKDIEVTQGEIASSDGLKIAYDVRGRGEPALVFVHCWACDRSFWKGQLNDLAADHKVVSLDLGGHGQSIGKREKWSLLGLAQDVKAVIADLELKSFVLVGHSMGGPVSLEVARLMPGHALGVIGIDTLHNAEFQIPEEMMAGFLGQYEANFEGTMSMFVQMMFPQGADQELVNWVQNKAKNAQKEPVLALFADFKNLDLKQAFQQAKVPVRCINAAPGAPASQKTETEINRKYADFDVALMEGVGHFLLLEKPDVVNQHLRTFIGEIKNK